MRPRTLSRAALMAGALSMSVAAPAAAQIDVTKKRLNVRAGQRALVVGTAAPGAVDLAGDPAPRRLAHRRP